MSKHTPGSWRFNGDEIVQNIDGSIDDPIICSVANSHAEGEDEFMANAHLIAAAPDMLYALEDLLAAVAAHDEPKSIDELGVIGRAMAVVKKAKGEK